VDLEGVYCVEGMIVGDESEDTIIDGQMYLILNQMHAHTVYTLNCLKNQPP
jgi:hypothetical protein